MTKYWKKFYLHIKYSNKKEIREKISKEILSNFKLKDKINYFLNSFWNWKLFLIKQTYLNEDKYLFKKIQYKSNKNESENIEAKFQNFPIKKMRPCEIF